MFTEVTKFIHGRVRNGGKRGKFVYVLTGGPFVRTGLLICRVRICKA